MPYAISALAVVSMMCILNLLLTYGVIRRLREHTELLSQRPTEAPEVLLAPGSTVDRFTATTVDGEAFTADDLQQGTLVGFFSPDCPACAEHLPGFVDAAAAHPSGQDRVLAVAVGATDDVAALVATLAPKARVVVADRGSAIEEAFAVRGYPAFALVGAARRVLASGGLDVVGAAAKAVW